jgi:hypothetical protein
MYSEYSCSLQFVDLHVFLRHLLIVANEFPRVILRGTEFILAANASADAVAFSTFRFDAHIAMLRRFEACWQRVLSLLVSVSFRPKQWSARVAQSTRRRAKGGRSYDEDAAHSTRTRAEDGGLSATSTVFATDFEFRYALRCRVLRWAFAVSVLISHHCSPRDGVRIERVTRQAASARILPLWNGALAALRVSAFDMGGISESLAFGNDDKCDMGGISEASGSGNAGKCRDSKFETDLYFHVLAFVRGVSDMRPAIARLPHAFAVQFLRAIESDLLYMQPCAAAEEDPLPRLLSTELGALIQQSEAGGHSTENKDSSSSSSVADEFPTNAMIEESEPLDALSKSANFPRRARYALHTFDI